MAGLYGWTRAGYLDTHSFQAPGFYRKLGCQEIAVIEDCPPGHRRHWFRKRLRG